MQAGGDLGQEIAVTCYPISSDRPRQFRFNIRWMTGICHICKSHQRFLLRTGQFIDCMGAGQPSEEKMEGGGPCHDGENVQSGPNLCADHVHRSIPLHGRLLRGVYFASPMLLEHVEETGILTRRAIPTEWLARPCVHRY